MPRQTAFTTTTSLVGLGLLGAVLSCRPAVPDNSAAQSARLVPTTYSVAGVRLSSPVKIISADYFTDGGSMLLKFRDVNDRELIAVHYTPIEAGTMAEQKRDGEPYRFYVGGFPKDRDAVKLTPGGEDERELQRLLDDCIKGGEETGGPLVHPDVGSESYDSRWDDYHDKNVLGFRARLAHEIQGLHTNRAAPAASRPN